MVLSNEELRLAAIGFFNVVEDLAESERHQDIYMQAQKLYTRANAGYDNGESVSFASEELRLLSIAVFSVVKELGDSSKRDKPIYKRALILLDKVDAERGE